MTALGLVLLGLGCWLVVSVAVAWAWGRAATLRRPTPDAGGQVELIGRLAAASEARVLDDPAAVAAWLDGGDPR